MPLGLPPTLRSKPPSLPPLAFPPLPDPMRPSVPTIAEPGLADMMGLAVPSSTQPVLPDDSRPTVPRSSAPSLPDPMRASVQTIGETGLPAEPQPRATLPHAIPPPPTPENAPAPSVLSARDSAVRIQTDSDEGSPTVSRAGLAPAAKTSVENDAEERTQARASVPPPRFSTPPDLRSIAPSWEQESASSPAPTLTQDQPDLSMKTLEHAAAAPPTGVVPSEPEEPLTRTSQIPISTAPASLPPPKQTERAITAGPIPACPQCDSPMGWVEEHLRFYCAQCRMYF
jgi:hypothetical protein